MSDYNQPNGTTDYRSYGSQQPLDQTTEAMGMMDYVKAVFSKYAEFSGRARRSEYWYFTLFTVIIYIALYIPVVALAVAESSLVIMPAVLLGLFALAVFIPSLAVAVRRLHDTGRSGWFYLISFIPFVGGIILIIFLVQDSQPGTNKWGPNPKGVGNTGFEQDAFA